MSFDTFGRILWNIIDNFHWSRVSGVSWNTSGLYILKYFLIVNLNETKFVRVIVENLHRLEYLVYPEILPICKSNWNKIRVSYQWKYSSISCIWCILKYFRFVNLNEIKFVRDIVENLHLSRVSGVSWNTYGLQILLK